DGTLSLARHDEGEGGFGDLPVMHGNPVFRSHVDEHAAEPVVRNRREKVRHDTELGAGEGGGDGIAAEGDGVVPSDRLLVAGRNFIREEGYVDIGLADEECLHAEGHPVSLFRHSSLGGGWRIAQAAWSTPGRGESTDDTQRMLQR